MLTDFPSYGEWSNFSKVEGVAKVGERLSMRMPGFSFKSTVTVVKPHEELEWAASLFRESIFQGRHTFTLARNPDGTTRVTNMETFSGGLVRPLKGFFKQRKGDQAHGYARSNRALKMRVESRGNR